MTFQDLTDQAIKILQERLDSDWIAPEEKIDIALKILAAKETEVTTKKEHELKELPSSINPTENASHTLPVPELYALSESWQKWLVENKLRGVSDQSLVDILKTQGIAEDIANQVIFTLPQEVTFGFIQAQWRSLQQYKFIAELYREQEKLDQFTVTRQAQLTQADFHQKYYLPHLPVILTDLGNKDPWYDAKSLMEKFGDRPITPKAFPLLHKQNLPDQKINIEKNQTLRDYFSQAEPNFYLDLDLADWGVENLRSFWTHYPQLSQYLNPQIFTPETIYLWLQSTFSPFPLQAKADNILVLQLYGESQWHLSSSWQSEFLYGDENWISFLDVTKPDLRRYPLLENAQFKAIHLQAGEALFIPAMWWQQCRAKQNSAQIVCLNFRDQSKI